MVYEKKMIKKSLNKAEKNEESNKNKMLSKECEIIQRSIEL